MRKKRKTVCTLWICKRIVYGVNVWMLISKHSKIENAYKGSKLDDWSFMDDTIALVPWFFVKLLSWFFLPITTTIILGAFFLRDDFRHFLRHCKCLSEGLRLQQWYFILSAGNYLWQVTTLPHHHQCSQNISQIFNVFLAFHIFNPSFQLAHFFYPSALIHACASLALTQITYIKYHKLYTISRYACTEWTASTTWREQLISLIIVVLFPVQQNSGFVCSVDQT